MLAVEERKSGGGDLDNDDAVTTILHRPTADRSQATMSAISSLMTPRRAAITHLPDSHGPHRCEDCHLIFDDLVLLARHAKQHIICRLDAKKLARDRNLLPVVTDDDTEGRSMLLCKRSKSHRSEELLHRRQSQTIKMKGNDMILSSLRSSKVNRYLDRVTRETNKKFNVCELLGISGKRRRSTRSSFIPSVQTFSSDGPISLAVQMECDGSPCRQDVLDGEASSLMESRIALDSNAVIEKDGRDAAQEIVIFCTDDTSSCSPLPLNRCDGSVDMKRNTCGINVDTSVVQETLDHSNDKPKDVMVYDDKMHREITTGELIEGGVVELECQHGNDVKSEIEDNVGDRVKCSGTEADNHICDGSNNDDGVYLTCEFCGKSFTRRPYLARHIRGHMNTFRCSTCRKQFSRIENLRSHRCGQQIGDGKEETVLATTDFPHQCKFCGAMFDDERYLVRHMATHTREFACSTCGRAFSRKKSLLQHATRYHPELVVDGSITAFACRQCNRVFTKAISLENHAKKHTDRFR